MDVDEFLESGIDMFQMEVKRRYDSPEDAAWIFRLAERIAQLVHEDVQLLAVKKGVRIWPQIRRDLSEIDVEEDLDLALQARLAWYIRPSFALAAKRCWELAELIPLSDPPVAVQRFLERVARCYLLDFIPECLVMCRGALENAINARYAAERVEFPRDADGRQTMKLRLTEAEGKNWLPPNTALALHSEVWMRGSKAAHGDPAAVGNALGAIKLTMAALETLSPPSLPE